MPDGDLGFGYRAAKDGTVRIDRAHRTVTTLRGRAAARFLARVADAGPADVQQEMARVTGNYRRGNERPQPGPSRG